MRTTRNKRWDDEVLTEVKAGQTGRGLLIEHDGHIVPNRDMVSQIKEDIAHHDEFIIPDKFIVSALFQKYGVKNANGRVYPEDILKREVGKYISECVSTRSSIGALDHPQCQLAGTKVLAENGWRNIEDVREGENILTLTEDRRLEIHPVIRKIESEYRGTMIRVHNESLDLKVTENHRFPVFGTDGKFNGFRTARQLMYAEENELSDSCLIRTGALDVCDGEQFEIPSEYDHEAEIPQSDMICLADIALDEEYYEGTVYCVEVENHDFYTMDWYGNRVWSGNSSTLSGHDVSHVITNLEWVGKTLIGEMEIHTTPGFKRYGIASTSGDLVANMLINDIHVGVSSRGVGNVVEKLGVLMVDDTFELIGWDVVCTPSTPGAFIATNRQELQQYVESDETKEGRGALNEKIERINRILL